MTNAANPQFDPAKLGFDPEVLRTKYRAERDKRIRPEGFGQYQAAAGDFSNFIEDHYVEPGFTREPLKDEVEVAIIGGGFGGLLSGARLRQAGVKDIRVIDKAGDFGGTWYWNRYPGAQCDIEAYVYLPLLEELGYIPSEKYSHAPEILEHSINIAKKFNLYDKACFQTEVTEIRWDENISRWIIYTDRGDEIKAQYVAMANGLLTRPKLPGIPGIEKFKGHTFHTSRWDYDYTGGSSDGDLNKLGDKRVGIIGTGATSIQCIPHLGAAAQQLYVFQRTPSSVDIRNNGPTDYEWAKTLEPGWHKKRMENFNALVTGIPQEEDLVSDGWTDIFRNLQTILATTDESKNISSEEQEQLAEIADFSKMEQVRARASSVVKDESTAEALKPYFRQFCKRPCFHDEYLDTYNRSNVTLVDTKGQGVDQVTETGVIVDGKEYELDCLVFATGFEVGTNYTSQSGYDVIGKGGISLREKWDNGLSTFHGLYSHGFPNAFFLGFTQTGLTANVPHGLNEQASHLAHVVKHGRDNNATTIEATQEAEDDWVATIHSLAHMAEAYFIECTPGYYNNEGKAGNRNGFLSGQYGGGPVEFFQILEDWRNEGSFKGLEIR
ncbi:MAG: NAD(P)/FAD-dependent oxidoreductase [Porticoccaceae bacterium]|nr:NAD(P)/FAD-dependent oxidoreductase [Porticoccaceae bacterium]